MKYLATKKQNILITIGISVVCLFLFHQSDALEGAGMAALVLNWLPLIVGIMTIIFYLITSLMSNKYAWIVTVIGNLFNIVLVIRAFMEG